MRNVFLKKLRNRAGFTMVELIVVIAILAILAAIAIPNYTAYTDQAKQAADRQTASVAVNAMAMYCADYRMINATAAVDTSDEWKTVLNAAGLWKTSDQVLQSDYYTGIVLSGPVNGVCTVTLQGDEDYVIAK